MQQEIAKDIAKEIKARITPEESARIEKVPTDDLQAYDWYLQGKELLYRGTGETLEKAIPLFKKAIAQDNEFALAYAEAVITYYYLDLFRTEKKYVAEIGSYADKALLYDSKSAESLVAKALFYMHKKEYELAIPYLEKALEYNPNAGLVIHFLSELYGQYAPNTGKYLEYALRGVEIDAAQDSATLSHRYMHLSNALMGAGFVDEAIVNINRSLAYNPNNPFSGWVKVSILYAKDKDASKAKERLIQLLNKDTTRFYIVQEIGKACYTMRDYETAYKYYMKFIDVSQSLQLDIFKHESLTIAMVLSKMGKKEEADKYAEIYKQFIDNDRSIYKQLGLGVYYAYKGDAAKAIGHMKLFSKEDNYRYWVLLLPDDPIVDGIKDSPEFKKVAAEIETNFWRNHEKIKASLEEKGLM